MTKRENKIIESPSGQGEIYKDGNRIARVQYSLRVSQGYVNDVPEYQDISGQFTVIDGERGDLSGSTLDLYLADGRKLKITVLDGSPVKPYKFKSASGEGFTS